MGREPMGRGRRRGVNELGKISGKVKGEDVAAG